MVFSQSNTKLIALKYSFFQEEDGEMHKNRFFVEREPRELFSFIGRLYVCAFVWAFTAFFEQITDKDFDSVAEQNETSFFSVMCKEFPKRVCLISTCL